MHSMVSKTFGKVLLPVAALAISASAVIGIGGSHPASANTGDGTFVVELSYQSVQFPLVFDGGHFGATAEAFGYMRAWSKNPTTGATSADGVREIAVGQEPAACDFVPAAWGWSSTIIPECKKRVEAGPTYDFADVMACREAAGGGCVAPYKQDNNTFLLHVRPGDSITAFLNLSDDDGGGVADDLCMPSKTVAGMTFEQLSTLNQTYTMAQGFNGTASCMVNFRLRTVDVPFHKATLISPTSLDASGSALFTWTGGDATKYRLQVGTTKGAGDVFDNQTYLGQMVVHNIPAQSLIYVRLSGLIDGQWQYTDYVLHQYPQAPAPNHP